MFERLLALWEAPDKVPQFQYYLKRHIELDGNEHGFLAEKMLGSLLEDHPHRWDEAVASARRALDARRGLWDAVVETIKTQIAPDDFVNGIVPAL